MSEPLKINFPVVVEPTSRQRIIVLWSQPVKPSHEAAPSLYVDVVGVCEDGRHYKVRLLKAEYDRACLAPIHFLECSSIGNAPRGELVEPNGKSFNT